MANTTPGAKSAESGTILMLRGFLGIVIHKVGGCFPTSLTHDAVVIAVVHVLIGRMAAGRLTARQPTG